jgi:hypothetical protein
VHRTVEPKVETRAVNAEAMHAHTAPIPARRLCYDENDVAAGICRSRAAHRSKETEIEQNMLQIPVEHTTLANGLSRLGAAGSHICSST